MKIVVIIPCRNEVAHIAECVNAIYSSNIEKDSSLSVVVVDGKSDDGTLLVLDELKLSYPSLEVVVNEKQLTPYAFNLGVEHVEDGDYFQIVGARQVLDKNYINGAIKRLREDETIWCVGGSVENSFLNSAGKIIAEAMSRPFGMGLGNFRTLDKSGFVDTVGTPMYPARVFKEIGYFDENLIRNQDDDFNYRVKLAGGKVYFDAAISVKYYVRGSFKGLWRQFFQYGYWKVYVNMKHKSVTTLRQLVPALFILYLVSIPLSYLFRTDFGLFYSIPFALYLVFNLFESIRGSSFFGLLKTFPILHMSYGLGYLKGIMHFALLGKKPSLKEQRLSR